MRSLAGVALRAPKLLAALLGLSLLFPVVSLAAPANADPAATTVTVAVVDANGDDLAGATVTLTGHSSGSDVTDNDGNASFDLAAGDYHLSFSKTGFESASLPADEGEGQATVTVGAGTVFVDGDLAADDTVQMKLDSVANHVLTGQVLGAGGAPLAGIAVKAVDQDDRSYPSTTSDAAGTFTLPVRIGTYNLTYLGAAVGNYTYVNTPYAVGQVEVGQGTVPPLSPQQMKVDDGSTKFDLKGTTSDWNGDPLNGVAATVVPAGGGAAVLSQTTAKIGNDDAAYKIGVRPGKYWLRFDKAGYQTTYLENGEDEGPVTVTVSPTGTVSAPDVELDLDGSLPDVSLLLPPAALVKAPKLTGAVAAGQTLTLSAGSWQGIDVDTDYVNVEWFLDGKPADDYSAGAWFQKFEVPVAAVGKKIGYKLTVDDPEGAHAASVFEGSTGVVPKAAARLKGAFKKGKLAVTLTVAGLSKPTGSIVVKDGKATVATIKLKAKSKGKAVVKLTKLKPGKHKLTLAYAGSKSVNAAKATVKAKV